MNKVLAVLTIVLVLGISGASFSQETGIVAKGEARLTGKTWVWVRALYKDGRTLTPKSPDQFTLKFKPDGTFSATTDCNALSGRFAATKDKISFSEIAATRMFCEASQESDFTALLKSAESYAFTARGRLILELKEGDGSATFE